MAADSKSELVYAQIRQDILDGALRPGESLSVLGMSERFSASRTPIRQAFLRLEAEGLLSLIDRQGARVAPISIQGVRDLFELRILLEGAATRQVAEAAAHSPTVHDAFERILSDLTAVAAQEPSSARRDRFYEIAETYDQAIISHTRNALLARQIAELRPHSARLRGISHSQPERFEPSLADHLAMCRAIVAHDAAAAAAAISEHLAQTRRTILDAVVNGTAVPIELVTA